MTAKRRGPDGGERHGEERGNDEARQATGHDRTDYPGLASLRDGGADRKPMHPSRLRLTIVCNMVGDGRQIRRNA